MIDISKSNSCIPMSHFYELYKKYNGKKLTSTLTLHGYSISKERAIDMYNRTVKFYKENKKLPNCVYVNPPKNSIKPTHGVILKLQEVIGKFTNVTEFVENMRKYAKKKGGLYAYYTNSKWLGTEKELNAISNGWLLNCVDVSQLTYAVITLLGGYEVRFIQYQCTNVTHLCVQVKGKEFKNWNTIDLAAITDKNSRRYEIGEHWCSKIVAIDPSWMFEKGLILK